MIVGEDKTLIYIYIDSYKLELSLNKWDYT